MNVDLHIGDLPDNISFGNCVAIDTETMGLNPHRDRLCLVQLSAGDGTGIWCALIWAIITPPIWCVCWPIKM